MLPNLYQLNYSFWLSGLIKLQLLAVRICSIKAYTLSGLIKLQLLGVRICSIKASTLPGLAQLQPPEHLKVEVVKSHECAKFSRICSKLVKQALFLCF